MNGFSVVSKVGNRDINEDTCISYAQGEIAYFVVADGLGGHGQGEVASGLVVDEIRKIFDSNPEMSPDEIVGLAIEAAQEKLMELQSKKHAKNAMKTTVVALYIKGNKLCWGHVGDSRLYAFSKGKVVAQTKDHSIPQMLVLSGELPQRKIRNHPQRNLLLRVMGIEWENPKYEVSNLQNASDIQAFLLCSDGFWELITEKEMCKLLKRNKTAQSWLDDMTKVVEKNGMNKDMDNYTAIAVIM